METNNFLNSIHVISETIIMGGITIYFYKKISELELTIQDLKNHLEVQNNHIKHLLELSEQPKFTPLKIPPLLQQQTLPPVSLSSEEQYKRPQSLPQQPRKNSYNFIMPASTTCENGVCVLEKKVAISKVSKQIEFDIEGIDRDETTKVQTFNNFSPNPVIKSVTPKSSVSLGESDLEKVLDDIDQE